MFISSFLGPFATVANMQATKVTGEGLRHALFPFLCIFCARVLFVVCSVFLCYVLCDIEIIYFSVENIYKCAGNIRGRTNFLTFYGRFR